jgi:hypothetical protein
MIRSILKFITSFAKNRPVVSKVETRHLTRISCLCNENLFFLRERERERDENLLKYIPGVFNGRNSIECVSRIDYLLLQTSCKMFELERTQTDT